MKPVFFASPAAWRKWLEKNHAKAPEVQVGFYKKGSGKASITWPESVDHALCFGWIDGVRNGIDETSYTIRFTPRRSTSTWSAVNIKRVAELTEIGLMQAAGLKAFELRKQERSGTYAYEQRAEARLEQAHEQEFRANQPAWDYFQGQAAWYRRTASWWVISAKREETRAKRLAILIRDSAEGRRIAQLLGSRPKKTAQSG